MTIPKLNADTDSTDTLLMNVWLSVYASSLNNGDGPLTANETAKHAVEKFKQQFGLD